MDKGGPKIPETDEKIDRKPTEIREKCQWKLNKPEKRGATCIQTTLSWLILSTIFGNFKFDYPFKNLWSFK